MKKDSKEYACVMNGLSQIPGLNLPIPGLTKQGYRPDKIVSENSFQTFQTPSVPGVDSIIVHNAKTSIMDHWDRQERKPLSKEDKRIFLGQLKCCYDFLNDKTLTESSDLRKSLDECLECMREIVKQNQDNYYLKKTYSGLLEAVNDLFHSNNHLKMVMKNTAEYIKSM
jgi:hypothetical protein